jgi:hypothetical protein
MTTPIPPRSKSPLTQLTRSPRTCVAIMTTVSLHPQRRRRNHPIPAVVRAAPRNRKRIPTVPPRGRELLIRHQIKSPETIERRASPKQSSCGEARHHGAEEQENAYRSESSRRLRPDSEIEADAFFIPHLPNISLTPHAEDTIHGTMGVRTSTKEEDRRRSCKAGQISLMRRRRVLKGGPAFLLRQFVRKQ